MSSGRDGTTDFPDADIVPIDLAYEFYADQNWDRGHHSLYTNAGGDILSADVTMFGTASGRLSGDRLRDWALYGSGTGLCRNGHVR